MALEVVSIDVPEYLAEHVTRLADEGVPVSALARGFKLPAETIREVLTSAVERGALIEVPPADWPVGQNKTARQRNWGPVTRSRGLIDDSVVLHCVNTFKVTRLQASLLAVLIKRKHVTKETLHQIIEARRAVNSDETDPKMVDVVICHLRKRLKPHNLTITTVWSCGYLMEPADRLRAAEMLSRSMDDGPNR